MDSKGHEVRAYKSCIAILSFSKLTEKEEIEMVSKVALESNILKVSYIESMLKTKSYLYYLQQTSTNNPCLNSHENIRGGAYYAKMIFSLSNKNKLQKYKEKNDDIN